MKKRSFFAALFGVSAAPLVDHATASALVSTPLPEHAPEQAQPEQAEPAMAQLAPADPLGEAASALAAALARGADDPRALAGAALDAFARADFSALDLNGPHTRAGDRVSKKGVRAGRRMILAALEAAPKAA